MTWRLLPIQLDLFVDFFPLIGPGLIFIGLAMVFVGTVGVEVMQVRARALTQDGRVLALVGIIIGILFTTIGSLRLTGLLQPYIVFLFCLGRTIEGAGTVRFIRKVVDFARGRGVGSLSSGLKYTLAGVFVTFLALWLVFQVLAAEIRGGGHATVQKLRLIWTAFVVATAAIGIARKLRHLEHQELNQAAKLGLILAVAGAEVYNFQSFTFNLSVYIVGSLAFAAGYWIAVYYLFSTEGQHDSRATGS